MQYFQWFKQGDTLVECCPASLFFMLVLVRILVRFCQKKVLSKEEMSKIYPK